MQIAAHLRDLGERVGDLEVGRIHGRLGDVEVLADAVLLEGDGLDNGQHVVHAPVHEQALCKQTKECH